MTDNTNTTTSSHSKMNSRAVYFCQYRRILIFYRSFLCSFYAINYKFVVCRHLLYKQR